MGKTTVNCCKNCIEREVGCHASCDLYLDFKAKNDENRRKVNQSKNNIITAKRTYPAAMDNKNNRKRRSYKGK